MLAAEKTRIRDALQPGSRIVVLDEKGDDLTTLKLARRLEAWMQDGRDVDEPVFIVFRTHRATEDAVEKAIADIDGLEVCTAPTVKIRILNPE